jgi:uncharacterized protein (TIGR02594 family)
MTTPLPARYAALAREPGPKMLLEALRLHGTLERPGTLDNPVIIAWARACPYSSYARWAADFYNDDAIPWCGLFMAVLAVRTAGGKTERLPPEKYLSALAWSAWGRPAVGGPMLGDVVTFVRPGGGHVALYVGEDATTFHVLGGNQSNAVNITRIEKTRLHAARRPAYSLTPANVRIIHWAAGGVLSTNEA